MRPLLKNLKLVASSTCVYAFCVLFPTVASCSESGKSIDDVLPPMEADSSSTTIEQRIELRAYVREHPEIRTILQDFVANVLADKPEDTVEFAKEYFSSLNQE